MKTAAMLSEQEATNITSAGPVILAICDGWGLADSGEGNATSLARTPHMDGFQENFPATSLTAHGLRVGLPEGQMGNSEVGHLNIGAGRVVYQDYTRINLAVSEGTFQKNEVLAGLMERTVEKGRTLHLLGLVSDGGVHSHIQHLIALLHMARQKGVDRVALHCCMDGRDTPPKSGMGYMKELMEAIESIGCGTIATVMGRYWGMDRDKRWERVEKAWQAIVYGQGEQASNGIEAMEAATKRGESDEFVSPTVIVNELGEPVAPLADGDSLLLYNFRADRMRQLCHIFVDEPFTGFPLQEVPELADLVTMTTYDADFPFPVAFPPMHLTGILGEELARHGKQQLRIAETEKYAHVTYFFNGGVEAPFSGEDRCLIDSPRDVATYDLRPEMSASQVTNALLERLESREATDQPYDVIILNYANCDMVGHTGEMEAAVKACETVDHCLGRLYDYIVEHGGVLLITADHGNAELMQNADSEDTHTAHSTNPVPFVMVPGKDGEQALAGLRLRNDGALEDIAPTILDLLHLPVPETMTGTSLLLIEAT